MATILDARPLRLLALKLLLDSSQLLAVLFDTVFQLIKSHGSKAFNVDEQTYLQQFLLPRRYHHPRAELLSSARVPPACLLGCANVRDRVFSSRLSFSRD